MKRNSKVSIALLMGALTCLTAGATACKDDGEGKFTLPTERTINAGVLYTPDFNLEKDVTVKLDGLKVPASSKTKAEGLSFTPDVLGTYEYSVVFTKGDSVWNETIIFNVVDTIAPTIKTKVADKTTEIGFYTDLMRDVESVVAEDNCATTIFVKPISITFGDKKTALADGEDTVFLPVAGEYVVEYAVSDFSGNEVKQTYKITASDTVAPVIDAPKAMVAWAEGNKTRIPAINVVDIGRTSYAVTAKDASGASVAVQDGYLMTNAAGKYVLTYVATDGAGNTSSAFEMAFIVNDKPLINTFDEEGEEALWNELSYGEDGKLKIMTSDEEVVFTFADNFNMKNWTGYNRFYLALENERGVKATVSTEVLINGGWVRAANDEIAPASFTVSGITASAKECGFWLADYGAENVEGVRITVASKGGVQVAIDEIGLTNETKPTAPTGTTGLVSGEMQLAAGQVIVRPITATSFGSNNAVSYKIWASAATEASIGLTIGGENMYITTNLKEGWNELFRLPTLESENSEVLTQQLTAISVQNKSAYGVSLYFDEFALVNKTSATIDELVSDTDGVGVIYGENYSIAWPFGYDDRYLSNLSVALMKEGSEVKSGLAIGDGIGVGEDITSGDYSLQYTFTDPFGETKQTEVAICVQKNVLTLEIKDEALFRTSAKLLDVQLVSEVYTENELNNATVERYYRRRGQSVWLDGSEEISFSKSAWYEFRYIATYDGVRREKTFSKYVHENKNVIDFEEESAAGTNCLIGGEYTESRFLYDGGYYNYSPALMNNSFNVSNNWSKSGDTSLYGLCQSIGWQGILIDGITATEVGSNGINAVSFWLSAEAGCTTHIELGGGKTSNTSNGTGASKGWYASEEFEVLSGTHYYTVFLTRTLKEDVCSFIIATPGRISFTFDDIEFKYLNRLSMDEVSYENYYDVSNPLVLEKPALTSDVYSQAALANAKYELSYTVDGGNPVVVREGTDGKFALTFAEYGKIALTWTVTVEGRSASQTTEFFAGVLELNAVVPTYVEHEGTVEFTAPTCEFDLTRYEVNYRKQGEGNWTPLTAADDNKFEFTPTKGGCAYEIQFVGYADVSGTELSGEVVKTIYAKDQYSLLCLEEEDFMQGAIWYRDDTGASHLPFATREEKEDGGHWVKFAATTSAWDGFVWKEALDFGFDTTALKMDVYSVKDTTLNFSIKADGVSGWHYKKVPVKAGAQSIVVDFGVNIRNLKVLIVEIPTTDQYYLDNISVMPPVDVTTTTPKKVSGNGTTVEFDAPTSPNEIKELVVEYKKSGDEEWTVLEAVEGKYSFTTEEDIAYSVRYTMICNVLGEDIPYEQIDEVINQGANTIFNFEGSDPLLGGASYTVTGEGANANVVSYNNSKWLLIDNRYNAWAGITWANGLDLGKATSKLQAKVYANKPLTNVAVSVRIASGAWKEIKISIPEGESTYVFDFSALGIDLNGMKAFTIITDRSYENLYLDNISFVAE